MLECGGGFGYGEIELEICMWDRLRDMLALSIMDNLESGNRVHCRSNSMMELTQVLVEVLSDLSYEGQGDPFIR